MTDRRCVILLFFDLPMTTRKNKKDYTQFRKFLKKNGYVYIQKSVLIKLIHNSSFAEKEITKLKCASPEKGTVYALPVCISNFMKLHSV